MSMLVEILMIGVVTYGLVYLIQDAKILDPLRERVRGEEGSFVDRLLRCSYCVGIWAGALLALGDLALTLLAQLGAEFWVAAFKRIVAWTLGGAVFAMILDPLTGRLQAWGIGGDDEPPEPPEPGRRADRGADG